MNENISAKEENFRGIDVSHWNGIIDWECVAKNGIRFAMLKCMNESNQKEISFEHNYLECLENGIYVGVYIYVVAMTKKRAETVINALLGILKNRTIQYGVWLDVEYKGLENLPKDELLMLVDFMLERLRRAGYVAGVYCNLSWYRAIFQKKQYLFWIARYPAKDNGEIHPNLDPGIGVCWQYSSKGKVEGIAGNVDLDLAKTDISEIRVDKPSMIERILAFLRQKSMDFLDKLC